MSTPQSQGSGTGEGGPRRFLIATAVSRYPKCPSWDRPGLVEAREQVIDVFTRQLGYRHHTALGLDPTRMQLTDQLRAFCKAEDRREDDLLAVYLSGHGQVLDDAGDHVLLASDTDPADIAYTALPTVELARAMLRETRVRRLLLILDTCYSGQGGNELAAAALERMSAQWKQAQMGSGLVIVSSAQPHQQAQAGLFPRLLTEAVGGWAIAGHGPDTLAVSTVVQQINDHPERPAWQHVSLSQIGLTGEPPPFLANPRHSTRLTDVDLAVQQAAQFDAHARRRETELINRLLIRAMGYHGNAAQGWWFCGRHTALADVAAWLRTPAADDASACRVITAGPGSGKTAVLGLIAALSHPERRRTVPIDALGLGPPLMPQEGAVDVAIYAQNLSDNDVLHGVAAAAQSRANTVGNLLQDLDAADRHRPLTVLIDALDEAATPHTLCTDVLRPLINHSRGRIRLLLGTRPYLLDRLGIDPDHPKLARRQQVINLDDDRYADPQALTAYTIRNLIEAHPASPYRDNIQALRLVAQAVAEAAGSSFLVARITAGTLAADPTLPDTHNPAWRASLPRHAGQAMHEDLTHRLGTDAQKAADLLRPLAFAEGQGLPWEDIWAPLASAISGRTYNNEDLLWLRHQAGSYVVEATEAGRSAYRLYHQALTEHLRENTDTSAVHEAFTDILTTRVPYRGDATRDWSRAHPYTLNHLAAHAAKAGKLDEILTHSEYLVHTSPHSLIPHLDQTRSASATITAAVYRTSLEAAVHRTIPGDHTATTPALRRQLLALNATRARAADLYHQLTRHIPLGHWTPVWATGNTLIPVLRGDFASHSGGVFAVACTVLDGTPVAVTGGTDGTVRVWDLTSRRWLGEPLIAHTSWVFAVACTVLDGTPIAVTTGNGTVRVWDLTSRRPLGEPLTGHTGPVSSVACTALDGAPAAVTSGADGTVRVWDLTSRSSLGKPLTSHAAETSRLTCTVLDNTPVALTTDNGTVRVWDLTSRRPLGEPLTGHGHWWSAVACTRLDGAPVAVTGGLDGTVQMWDLTSRRPLGEPLTRHARFVSAVACTVLDGTPIAVTTGGGRVRVWDLRTGEAAGLMAVPNPRAVAVSAAGDLVVGIGRDVAVFRRRTAAHHVDRSARGVTVGGL